MIPLPTCPTKKKTGIAMAMPMSKTWIWITEPRIELSKSVSERISKLRIRKYTVWNNSYVGFCNIHLNYFPTYLKGRNNGRKDTNTALFTNPWFDIRMIYETHEIGLFKRLWSNELRIWSVVSLPWTVIYGMNCNAWIQPIKKKGETK